jgi:tRNA A58 N-methylase Trm61
MNDQELKLKIDNLVSLIEVEEENYKTALQNKTEFVILQKMKDNIESLKSDFQVFVDQQSVRKTGELPTDN